MHSYILCPVENDLNPTICTNSFWLVSTRFDGRIVLFNNNMQADFTLNASSPCTWPIILLIIFLIIKSRSHQLYTLLTQDQRFISFISFIFIFSSMFKNCELWTHFFLFITCVVNHSNHSRVYLRCISKQWYAVHIASIDFHNISHFFKNETNERTQQNRIVNDDDEEEDGETSTSSYPLFHKWTIGITCK